jgi:UDP-N-acetylglucosamine:LPS N-acetylglucosamine transferase
MLLLVQVGLQVDRYYKLRTPCVFLLWVQEQNSYPGITNKLLSKKAGIICAYENLDRFFQG